MKRKRTDIDDRYWIFREAARISLNISPDICKIEDDDVDIGNDDEEVTETKEECFARIQRRAQHHWERAVRRRTQDVHCVIRALDSGQLAHLDSIIAELGDDLEDDLNDTSQVKGFFDSDEKKKRRAAKRKLHPKKPKSAPTPKRVPLLCDCGGNCGSSALECRMMRWFSKTFGVMKGGILFALVANMLMCRGEMIEIFSVEHIKDVSFSQFKHRMRVASKKRRTLATL